MTSSAGTWVAVPIPGEPDRWDFVPAEQPPSPDGSAGMWHVVGGSGDEVGQWEWFPSATDPVPLPPVLPPPAAWETTASDLASWEPVVSEPVAWPTMPEPADWPSLPEPADWEPAESPTATSEPIVPIPVVPVLPAPIVPSSPSWRAAAQEPAQAGFPVPPPPDWASAQPVLSPAPKRSRKLPMAIAGTVLVLGVIAAGAAVALSGGDDGKNSDEITALVNFVATADDGADVCRSHLTEDFVRTVFGDLATCERDDDRDGDEGDATGATVTDVVVDDDDATAVVTVTGGDTDGATGTWAFRRGEDKVWRVAEWRPDYLRSSYDKTFGVNYASDGPDDPFDDVDVRTCVKNQLLGLDDPAFLSTAYALFRDSAQSTPKLLGLMSECPSEIEGVSALRALFEKGLRAKISAQLQPQVAECAITGWRTAMSEAEILTMMQNEDAPLPTDVQGRMQQVLLSCAGDPSQFDPT